MSVIEEMKIYPKIWMSAGDNNSYEFTIVLWGSGEDIETAWENAKAAFREEDYLVPLDTVELEEITWSPLLDP
jgi:hypothetical protein